MINYVQLKDFIDRTRHLSVLICGDAIEFSNKRYACRSYVLFLKSIFPQGSRVGSELRQIIKSIECHPAFFCRFTLYNVTIVCYNLIPSVSNFLVFLQ